MERIAEDFEDLGAKARKYLTFSFHRVWQDADQPEEVNRRKLEVMDFFKQNGLSVASQENIDTVRDSCYADKKNHATINYNGEVFKCTARDFTSDTKEGMLSSDGLIHWNEKYHQRLDAKFKNPPCLKCSILPICNGGCSQQALESKGEFCVVEDAGMSKSSVVLEKFLSQLA